MTQGPLPNHEPEIRRALSVRAPELSALPIRPLAHGGTETRVYRLGERHVIRIPLDAGRAGAFVAEAQWLRRLAPHLPCAVPDVLVEGWLDTDPSLPWTLGWWIDGADAAQAPPADLNGFAEDLADVVIALRRAPVPVTPPSSPRGGPLAPHDGAFRAALAEADAMGLGGLAHARTVWERGLAAPEWEGPPVWLHADLVPGNLILRDGRLAAVIDWSCATVGDPAYDLIPAWFLLDPPARDRFLDRLAPDKATLARGRARVAWQCVMALPYYLDRNPAMVGLARRGLAALETDDR
jgi:aminoglycoside phosphotransferase (APT) family kinase protein